MDVIIEQTRLLGASAAALFFADAERRELSLVGHRGLPPDWIQRSARLDFDGPSLTGRAARTREVEVVDQDSVEPAQILARELLQSTGASAVVAAPLVAAGRLVGVLTIALAGPRRFGEDDLAAIRAVADVDAASIEAARAVQEERSRLECLHVGALAIATPSALTSVLQSIVEHARTVVRASYAALGIVGADPEGPFEPWVFSGMSELEASRIGRLPRPVGLLGAVVDEGRTIRLSDLPSEARFRGFPPGHPPMTSFLGVPIRYLGRAVGNLYLANKEGAAEFSHEDQELAEMLAQHAGIAVEHAREHDLLLREIAERKRDQETVRQSEERFRRLAENAHDVIARWRLRPSFAVEYVNPAVRDVLGHTPEEYYRDPGLVRRQVHPSDRWLLEIVQRVPERRSEPVAIRWIHASGAIVCTESRFVPIRDQAGELTMLEVVSRDVSDRKRAEGEIDRLMGRLQVDRAWLETVIQHSPVGIILVEDRLGRRIRANPAAEKIFGRELRPECGIEQLVEHLRDARGARLSVEGLLVLQALHGESVTGERLCVRPDGVELPVLVRAAPVRRDERTGASGAVVIYQDISAPKELERLRQEWTSIVAHDLRQPVSVIAMGLGALARHVVHSPANAKIVARMHGAVAALRRMVDDLLDASRLDARQLPLRRESVDMASLAREVVEASQESLAGRETRVETRGDIPKIMADSLRLGQVLGNLLSNAVKYGAPGTPIDVTVELVAGEVVVSVTNRGEAISLPELPSLFERFRRTTRAAKAGTPGVGLGLYIAKGLVEAHGGKIWAESAPGDGMTFRFSLPVEGAARGRAA